MNEYVLALKKLFKKSRCMPVRGGSEADTMVQTVLANQLVSDRFEGWWGARGICIATARIEEAKRLPQIAWGRSRILIHHLVSLLMKGSDLGAVDLVSG